MALSRLAIVGGGFSGLMVAAHMVRLADGPMEIDLIEPAESIGHGLAYATTDPAHLLNVRADRMGAWAERPAHFMEWLETYKPGQYRPADFVPRMVYGEYLTQIWQETKQAASSKTVGLRHRTCRAVGLEKTDGAYRLQLSDGSTAVADAVLLAFGNPLAEPSRLFSGLTDTGRILPSAWESKRLRNALQNVPPDAELFILGSGLTMVDTVLTLAAHGFKGKMTALSRHGHLPHPHRATQDYDSPIGKRLMEAPPSVRRWFRVLRLEIEQAQRTGGDWRSVIDALRPHSVALWQKLPITERRRFFRHLFSLWNIHRHRMAPHIHESLLTLMQQGRLELLSGRLQRVEEGERIHLWGRLRDGGELQRTTDYLIACVGPGYDLRRSNDALVSGLLAQGMLAPHATGLGVQANGYHATCEAGLMLIGTPLIGDRLETTAVPELRQEACDVASAVLDYFSRRT